MAEFRVIEQAVLRKKITLQYYLDSILTKSRLIRYAHILFTVGSPRLGFIGQMTSDSSVQTASIYIGVIAAGLSRLPDILRISATTSTLKSQIKLYDTLYGKIVLSRRMNDMTAVQQLAKEYRFIESNDLDIPATIGAEVSKKFVEYGIVVESPMEQLKKLNHTPEIVHALADVRININDDETDDDPAKLDAIERLKNLQDTL